MGMGRTTQQQEQRQGQLSPVRDVIQEVLLEHQAPPFDLVEQGCPEGPRVEPEPALEGLDRLHGSHLLVQALVGADVLPEPLQRWRRLGDSVLAVGLEVGGREGAAVEQELAAQLPPVLPVEVREALQPRAVLAARGRRRLSAAQQLLAC